VLANISHKNRPKTETGELGEFCRIVEKLYLLPTGNKRRRFQTILNKENRRLGKRTARLPREDICPLLSSGVFASMLA
jgi:hypothetical protein